MPVKWQMGFNSAFKGLNVKHPYFMILLLKIKFHKLFMFYVLLTVHISLIYVNNQTGTIIFHICLFLFCTCFGQPCAHHQEN
jgi:hypothetical protein